MNEPWVDQLREHLVQVLGEPLTIQRLARLAGGASKEAWAVDVLTREGTLALLVRRAGGGVIFADTLSLEHEYRVIEAAYAGGVKAPKPYGYLADLGGKEAFVMERLNGESIGRRIVQRAELSAARRALPTQMAEQLARIHAIPLDSLPFLPGDRHHPVPDLLRRLQDQLDSLDEPHPAIELGLLRLRQRMPDITEAVVNHGDFRIGNLMVDENGLVGVLDWEFSHIGTAVEDLAWPLVRAWRFGVGNLRLGGIGPVEPYLEQYNALTGRGITVAELDYWELMGNVRWAIGCLTQGRRHIWGQERNVELAVLGRLACEIEYEIVHLVERAG